MSGSADASSTVAPPLSPRSAAAALIAAMPKKLSRMELLGRRDASRWGGAGALEQAEAAKKAEAARRAKEKRRDPAILAGPPLEQGGADTVGSNLHASLLQLQRIAAQWDSPEAAASDSPLRASCRAQLATLHRTVLGLAGLAPPKPPKRAEDDPPPPPPPAPLLAIDEKLIAAARARGSAQNIAPELLVATAETAAKLGEWETVWSCLSLFSSSTPPLSQYRLRALLVQARAQAQQAQGEKGETFLAHVQAGMQLVLNALQLLLSHAAQVLPAYNFLLYNCAAVFMHIARPLMRDGMRHHLVRGLTALAQALDEHIPAPPVVAAASPGSPGSPTASSSATAAEAPVSEKNAAFEIELLRALVMSLEETGDSEGAARYFGRAWSLLTRHYPLAPLAKKTEILRTGVHVLRNNPRAIDALEADPVTEAPKRCARTQGARHGPGDPDTVRGTLGRPGGGDGVRRGRSGHGGGSCCSGGGQGWSRQHAKQRRTQVAHGGLGLP